MIEAYPLCWPTGYARNEARRSSRFKTSMGEARDFLRSEIRRIGGDNPIISTNVPLKRNGDLYASWGNLANEDPGVAVYFERNGRQICLCCDTYARVWENLHAVGRTIEALRQIDRDGVSDFLDRTFTGFQALPEAAAAAPDIWRVLGLEGKPGTLQELKEAYRRQAHIVHPDKPTGSAAAFNELQVAFQSAQTYFK